jgi:hypothetical protein
VGANDYKCGREQRLNVPSGARDNKFLVTHPMTDQHCLTSTILCTKVINKNKPNPFVYLVGITHPKRGMNYFISSWQIGKYTEKILLKPILSTSWGSSCKEQMP